MDPSSALAQESPQKSVEACQCPLDPRALWQGPQGDDDGELLLPFEVHRVPMRTTAGSEFPECSKGRQQLGFLPSHIQPG